MGKLDNLRFTKTHEWIDTSEQNMTMGITDHAQSLLGDIVFVELPEPGAKVHAGQEIGLLESVKAAADFYAPLSGTIIAINANLSSHPELINQEPYNGGWICKIAPEDQKEHKELLDAAAYKHNISQD